MVGHQLFWVSYIRYTRVQIFPLILASIVLCMASNKETKKQERKKEIDRSVKPKYISSGEARELKILIEWRLLRPVFHPVAAIAVNVSDH